MEIDSMTNTRKTQVTNLGRICNGDGKEKNACCECEIERGVEEYRGSDTFI